MNIPSGMNETEVLKTIELVVNRLYKKYVFYGFDEEDIKQESYIICIEALDRYKDGYPLENFLSFNLSRRLKNLIRDNFFTSESDESKKRLKMPAQLSYEENTGDTYETDSIGELDVKNIVDIIDRELDYEFRADYLKLINDDFLPKKRKINIIKKIKNIVEQYGYEPNEDGPDI